MRSAWSGGSWVMMYLALEQRGDAGSRLGNGAHDEPVHVDLAAPVVGIGVEHGLVVLHPRAEPHGAGAHGLGVERVGADRLQVFLWHDLASVEGQASGQERIGLLRVNDERIRIRGLDPVDRGQGRGHHGLRRGIVGPLDAVLGVGRREGITVVVLHPLTQLEGPRRLPLELPLRGEAGMELAIRVTARQIVEDIEAPADLVGRGAEVGIELRDVTALRDDQLPLLGRLGVSRSRHRARQRSSHTQGRRTFQQLTSRHVHALGLRGGLGMRKDLAAAIRRAGAACATRSPARRRDRRAARWLPRRAVRRAGRTREAPMRRTRTAARAWAAR